MREGAQLWTEKVYLRDGACELTYAEAWRRIESIAAWLYAKGVGRGDRVVMVTENRIETVLMFFAVAQIGGISVILHPQMKPGGLRFILEQIEPKLGMLEQSTASTSRSACKTCSLPPPQIRCKRPSKVRPIPMPLRKGHSDPSPSLTSPALLRHPLPTQFSEAVKKARGLATACLG